MYKSHNIHLQAWKDNHLHMCTTHYIVQTSIHCYNIIITTIHYIWYSVKYIIIVIVMITTGAIAVSKLLVGNCTLQVLNVSSNDIGDDGISVIVEQLQHITTLTELYVGDCGLSAKGTVVCVRCILVHTVRITLQYH